MPSKTLSAAREALKLAKKTAWENEISDDFYNLSGQQKKDEENIKFWENRIKELENNEN